MHFKTFHKSDPDDQARKYPALRMKLAKRPWFIKKTFSIIFGSEQKILVFSPFTPEKIYGKNERHRTHQ